MVLNIVVNNLFNKSMAPESHYSVILQLNTSVGSGHTNPPRLWKKGIIELCLKQITIYSFNNCHTIGP